MFEKGKPEPGRFTGIAVIMSIILSILVCPAAQATTAVQKTKTGTVTGLIGIPGIGPMMGGTVFFFNASSGPPPSPSKYWRVPDESYPVDQSARFTAALPAGKYFMAAIERRSGEESSGPPEDGDYLLILQDRRGKPRQVTVKSNRIVNLGYLGTAQQYKREALDEKKITAIEGTIRDEKGNPVGGIAVFAFTSRAMSKKPLFVSERSSKDGTYQLRLYGGGTYYLQARTSSVGIPSADELSGIYDKGRAVAVAADARQTGIDIVVSRAAAAAP